MMVRFAHAFGQRYDLPIPLLLFVIGGAAIVFLSFLIVMRQTVAKRGQTALTDDTPITPLNWLGAVLSFLGLAGLVATGFMGSQEVAENIVPTLFWLIIWIAVPLSCGLIGDWTQPVNPLAAMAKLTDSAKLRRVVLGRTNPFAWPGWLGWWPAVVLFFALATGELIYNQTATLPEFIAASLLSYFIVSAFAGMVFGRHWLERGEVFTVLFSTWGRLGFFRFGAPGRRGFARGLDVPFEPSPSRVIFVLLMLASVNFDGLISTPAWNSLQLRLPSTISPGTPGLHLLSTLAFAALVLVMLAVFMLFAIGVNRLGRLKLQPSPALAGLLPSLVPIAFGYLLAHNLQYLLVNGQLLFPLIGNPVGSSSWPLKLPYPFNDTYDPSITILPSAFYWYAAVVVIVVVHIIAVVLAHRHLEPSEQDATAQHSEYPWMAAMVGYTMLSLWLLAQPLVKEKSPGTGQAAPVPMIAER